MWFHVLVQVSFYIGHLCYNLWLIIVFTTVFGTVTLKTKMVRSNNNRTRRSRVPGDRQLDLHRQRLLWSCRLSRTYLPRRFLWFCIDPCGLPFTWSGCCGLRVWHKPTELARSFLSCFCVCFCLYRPFSCISFHKFSRQLSPFSTLFFWSYFCLIGPFGYYICLWKSTSALI